MRPHRGLRDNSKTGDGLWLARQDVKGTVKPGWESQEVGMHRVTRSYKEYKSCSFTTNKWRSARQRRDEWTGAARLQSEEGANKLQKVLSTSHPHLCYWPSTSSSFYTGRTLSVEHLPKCPSPGIILPNMLPLVFMKKKPYILHEEERQKRLENVNPQELESKTMHCPLCHTCSVPQITLQDMPGRKATGLMHCLSSKLIFGTLVWHPDKI